MKATLSIDERLMASLKGEAARRGITVSALVEKALRKELRALTLPARPIAPLPRFDSGGALVEVSDRDALDAAMEDR